MSRVLRLPEHGDLLIRGGEKERIEVRYRGGLVLHTLRVPREVAEGVDIVGIGVPNRGMEVPFIIKAFPAELFDGDATRAVPYGRLPRVPADPEGVVFLEVENRTVRDKRFYAEFIVLEEGIDYTRAAGAPPEAP